MNSKVERVQELRRSNAATAIPSRKVRKSGGRQNVKHNAVKEGWK
jgi:hypothetical protein